MNYFNSLINLFKIYKWLKIPRLRIHANYNYASRVQDMFS